MSQRNQPNPDKVTRKYRALFYIVVVVVYVLHPADLKLWWMETLSEVFKLGRPKMLSWDDVRTFFFPRTGFVLPRFILASKGWTPDYRNSLASNQRTCIQPAYLSLLNSLSLICLYLPFDKMFRTYIVTKSDYSKVNRSIHIRTLNEANAWGGWTRFPFYWPCRDMLYLRFICAFDFFSPSTSHCCSQDTHRFVCHTLQTERLGMSKVLKEEVRCRRDYLWVGFTAWDECRKVTTREVGFYL